MKLHPLALAKTTGALVLIQSILNFVATIVLVGFEPLANLGWQTYILSLVVTPLIAAVVGYVFARLYNYFLPA